MSQIFTSSMNYVDIVFYLQERNLENPIIVNSVTAEAYECPVSGIHLQSYDLFSRHVVILSKPDSKIVSAVLRDDKWDQFFKANRFFLSEEEYPNDFPAGEKKGKVRNLPKAIELLTDLSDRHQFAPAQNSLALCYYWGLGVERDRQKMLTLFERAAEQNFAIAERNLGWCYQEGKGVDKYFRTAFTHYKTALERGLTSVLCDDIAWLYENATPPNPNEALRLYRYAAKLGLHQAAKQLDVLNKPLLINQPEVASDDASVEEGTPTPIDFDFFHLVPRLQALQDKVKQMTELLTQKDQYIIEIQKQLHDLQQMQNTEMKEALSLILQKLDQVPS